MTGCSSMKKQRLLRILPNSVPMTPAACCDVAVETSKRYTRIFNPTASSAARTSSGVRGSTKSSL